MPRKYEHNYPSVTEIIQEIFNKGEGFWRWKLLGSEESHEKGKKKAASGTKIHSLVNQTSQGKRTRYPKIYKPIKHRIEDYFRDKTLILNEKALYDHDQNYCGTPDYIYSEQVATSVMPPIVLEDLKTGKYRQHEYDLQLGAYVGLARINGYTIDKARNLMLQDGHITPMPWIDLDNAVEAWWKVLWLYKWKYGIP